MNRLCIDRKPFRDMNNQEKGATVHAAMVLLGKRQWTEAGRWLEGVWKPMGDLLRTKGLSPLAKRSMIRAFWSELKKLDVPELKIFSETDRTVPEFRSFFKFIDKYYDDATGKFAEAEFLRKLRKSSKLTETYAFLRPKIVQYLEGIDRKTPEGISISSLSDAFAVTHSEGAPVIPQSITNPIGEGGIWDSFVEAAKSENAGASYDTLTAGTNFSKWLPTKEVFRSIGKRFGKKFSKLYLEGEKRRIAYDAAMRERGKEIADLLGPHVNNVQFRERMSGIVEDAMHSPKHPDYEYFQKEPPTSEELKMATQIRNKLNEWGVRYAIPKDAWLKEYLPHMRERGTFDPEDFTGALPTDKKTLGKFFLMERTGVYNPHTKDILEILRGYTRVGEKNLAFMDDGWYARASSTMDELRGHPHEYDAMSNYMQDIVDNKSSRLAFKLQTLEYLSKFVNEKFHIPIQDSRLLGSLYLKSIYSGALGLRIVPLLKQAFQTILLGGTFYGKYLAKGIEAATKSEAWEYVNRMHILPEYTLGSMGMGPELQEVLSNMGSKWTSMYSRILDKMGKGYMKADSLNRVIGFWSGKSMFLEATEKRLAGKMTQEAWEKAVRYKWFDGFEDIQGKLKSVLEHPGDKDLLRDVSDLYGKHTTEDFNWVYRRGNSPTIMREHPYLLQFGTWPANFTAYMGRLAEYGLKTGDYSMWLRMVGIGAGTYAAGRMVGADLRSIYAFPSLFYMMGPTPNFYIDGVKMLKTLYYGGPDERISMSQFMKDLTVFLPAGLAAKGLYEGYIHGDPVRAFGLKYLEGQDNDFWDLRP